MAEDRRNLLKALSALFGGGVVSIVGLPSLRALIDPRTKDTVRGHDGFVPVTALSSVPVDGSPAKASVVIEAPIDAWARLPATQIGAVYLLVNKIEDKDPEVTAYSTLCPHLGCGIDYDVEAACFKCPCHESAFDLSGRVIGGPSPRSMDRLETRIADGRIDVRYQRFKNGTKEKLAL